jgi:hypothetical protein
LRGRCGRGHELRRRARGSRRSGGPRWRIGSSGSRKLAFLAAGEQPRCDEKKRDALEKSRALHDASVSAVRA